MACLREVTGTPSGGEFSWPRPRARPVGRGAVACGGIRLGAIFADEGFGTPDADSLDGAIRALRDLRQAGRIVGIVLHVAERKERIETQLDVVATARGSVAVGRSQRRRRARARARRQRPISFR